MKVYAIHREGVWTTDYNVMICSSKKIADSKIKKWNEHYHLWHEAKKSLSSGSASDYWSNADYMDFIYNNTQPPKFIIEKIEVLTK